MTDFDPELGVVISGNEIVVVLPGSIYSVTYFKRRGSPGLLAKNIANKNEPRIPMTARRVSRQGMEGRLHQSPRAWLDNVIGEEPILTVWEDE